MLLGGADYTPLAHSGGQAASFGGASAWAVVSQMDLGKKFTIAGWIFLSDVLQSQVTPIVGNVLSYFGGDGFQFFAEGSRIAFGLSDGTEDVCTHQSMEGELTANTWHHVAVTFDYPGRSLVLYHNGVAVQKDSSGCFPYESFATSKDLFLGGFGSKPSGAGALDDVRIYDSALSAAEVAAIAQD